MSLSRVSFSVAMFLTLGLAGCGDDRIDANVPTVPPELTTVSPDPIRATIVEPLLLTGTGFGPVGGALTARFTATIGTPFAGGTSATADVLCLVTSATNAIGVTPLAETEVDFTAAVRLHLSNGLVSPPKSVTFRAPPVVRLVLVDPELLDDPTSSVLLACGDQVMRVFADNLDIASAVSIYETAFGPGVPFGTGTLTPIPPTPLITVNPGLVDDEVEGLAPTEPSLSAPTEVTVRITNPDGQVDESAAVEVRAEGALRNREAIVAAPENAGAALAVNPNDRLHMVAASNGGPSATSTTIQLAITHDGGNTWTARTLGGPSADTTDGGNDALLRFGPRVAFDRFGNLWMSYSVGGNARIGLSADGGLTFPSGDTVGGSGDEPPGLAVGPSASPGIETADLIVTNTASDTVYALTFGSNALGNYQVLVGAGVGLGGGGPVWDLTATTGPGGAVYAAWAVDVGGGLSEVRVNGDRDGSQGAVFAYAGQVTVVGNTGGPRFTGVEAAPEFGAPTSPQLAVIRNGAQAGRLVVTFTRNQGGTAASPLLDVESLVSDDFGVTFFANGALPVPVHPASANDQFNPAMTTDLTAADGRVYVTWYDARNDGANTRVERYAAASVDGITWGAPIRLSPPSDLSGAGSLDDYFWQQDVVAEGGCAWAAWTHEGTASLGDVRVTRFQAQP